MAEHGATPTTRKRRRNPRLPAATAASFVIIKTKLFDRPDGSKCGVPTGFASLKGPRMPRLLAGYPESARSLSRWTSRVINGFPYDSSLPNDPSCLRSRAVLHWSRKANEEGR